VIRWLTVLLLSGWILPAAAAQLFIPVDAQGNPIETGATASDTAIEDIVPAESPAAKAARELREAEFALALEQATVDYADCLKSESDRRLGTNYDNCAAAREQLRSYYPNETAEITLGCVEAAVLGAALDGTPDCPLLRNVPTPDVSNAERWR
jgi:hypothetical protein